MGAPRFMVALGSQGLNNLGGLDCWLGLVVGASGIVGFIEPRLATEEVYEEPGPWRITLIGPFGSQGICGAVLVKLAKVS